MNGYIMKNNQLALSKGLPMPLGVTKHLDGMNFAISIPNEEECILKLFHKKTGVMAASFLLTSEYKTGNVFSCMLSELMVKENPDLKELIHLFDKTDAYTYIYEVNGKEFVDSYAKLIYGREVYGEVNSQQQTYGQVNSQQQTYGQVNSQRQTYGQGVYREGSKRQENFLRGNHGENLKLNHKLCSSLLPEDYPWEGDKPLYIPYSQLIIYKLHLRGFTKHPSSKVKNPGTFQGLTEKIPYLKELGINCIQLMPIYEFNENIWEKGIGGQKIKLNYWGYSEDNFYFAPKSSYAANPAQADIELKSMISKLHQEKIEVILEMYFPYGTNHILILDCLKYWAMEYHIDGFHLIGESIPRTTIAMEPLLNKTKLFATCWDKEQIYNKGFVPAFKNLAEYNDGYSVDIKGFLRGDESKVSSFASRFKYNPDKFGVINYITSNDGFTLMDLYSYDVKHNEANGENNRDGLDYNYSWNCGKEGETNNRSILNLRRKQIRNAFTILLLSQGTPLILAGDEFGNSQLGNNNAYCQDNEISWINWDDLNNNKDIFEFVKPLISIRKCHPILHMKYPLKSMDYISSGYPDLSYHGTKAWYPDYSFYSRMLGIMLAGQYAKVNSWENDINFYIAWNMHWEEHAFDLPSLPKNMKWHVLIDTAGDKVVEDLELIPLSSQSKYEVKDRSIAVLIGK